MLLNPRADHVRLGNAALAHVDAGHAFHVAGRGHRRPLLDGPHFYHRDRCRCIERLLFLARRDGHHRVQLNDGFAHHDVGRRRTASRDRHGRVAGPEPDAVHYYGICPRRDREAVRAVIPGLRCCDHRRCRQQPALARHSTGRLVRPSVTVPVTVPFCAKPSVGTASNASDHNARDNRRADIGTSEMWVCRSARKYELSDPFRHTGNPAVEQRPRVRRYSQAVSFIPRASSPCGSRPVVMVAQGLRCAGP